jgi:hypothetical protein
LKTRHVEDALAIADEMEVAESCWRCIGNSRWKGGCWTMVNELLER